MTPVFCCGFECGVLTAHFSAGGLSNGTPTFATSPVNNGLRSIRCNATTNTNYAQSATSYSGDRRVGRVCVRFTTLPSADTSIIATDVTGPNPTGPCVRFKQSDSKLYAAVGSTLGASGASVTINQWYRVDFDFNITAGSDTADVQIDGTAVGQASATGLATGTSANIALGFTSSVTGDIYFDDFIYSNTGSDYPIGAGKVLSFVPNADGTHTATSTHIVKGTLGTPVGTAITSATTDAFNWVNGRPLLGGASDNTRLINQQTLLSTEYVEVDFEPTIEVNAPRAVEVVTADQQAATQSGGFSTKLNDNGTEDVIITRSAAGVQSDRYATKQYATMVGGGAWTLARFNALKARFGYSGDATPDQYWRGIMIEAEFPESLDASAFGIPEGPSGQRQMQQLLSQ